MEGNLIKCSGCKYVGECFCEHLLDMGLEKVINYYNRLQTIGKHRTKQGRWFRANSAVFNRLPPPPHYADIPVLSVFSANVTA